MIKSLHKVFSMGCCNLCCNLVASTKKCSDEHIQNTRIEIDIANSCIYQLNFIPPLDRKAACCLSCSPPYSENIEIEFSLNVVIKIPAIIILDDPGSKIRGGDLQVVRVYLPR